MKKLISSFLAIIFLLAPYTYAQHLKPGFDKAEYIEMLKIVQRQHIDIDKWNTINTVPEPQKFKFAYRSPVMSLDNIWDLWLSKDSVAVISIRGSIESNVSFLVNFYAAMVPAKRRITIRKFI